MIPEDAGRVHKRCFILGSPPPVENASRNHGRGNTLGQHCCRSDSYLITLKGVQWCIRQPFYPWKWEHDSVFDHSSAGNTWWSCLIVPVLPIIAECGEEQRGMYAAYGRCPCVALCCRQSPPQMWDCIKSASCNLVCIWRPHGVCPSRSLQEPWLSICSEHFTRSRRLWRHNQLGTRSSPPFVRVRWRHCLMNAERDWSRWLICLRHVS